MKTEAEIGVMAPRAKERGRHQKLEVARNGFLISALEDSVRMEFSVWNCERRDCHCFEPPLWLACESFVSAAQETKTRWLLKCRSLGPTPSLSNWKTGRQGPRDRILSKRFLPLPAQLHSAARQSVSSSALERKGDPGLIYMGEQ